MKNIKKTITVMAMTAALAMSALAPAVADGHLPSTNDANKASGAAHFNVADDTVPGQVTVEFVSTNGYSSCFEYRSDGVVDDTTANFNPEVQDGLYPFTCVTNETKTVTILADGFVEIRSAFGGESDERFDWTRVDVTPVPRTKEDCKDGGWEDMGEFKNQGDCVSSFARS